MTESSDIIPRWKSNFNSECPMTRLKALAEIITTIDRTEKCKREQIYEILINREICHFICEILSYNELKRTPFINKIICYLSESSKFYRDEIFRVLKTYLRLLNGLPESRLLYRKFNKYFDDIFKLITILLMRSDKLGARPFHDERFSLIQFVAIASKISNCFSFHQSALVLINVMFEVIAPLIETQEVIKQQHINQYIISIIRNLIIQLEKFTDVRHFLIVSKIICNLTTYVSHERQNTVEERIIMKITTSKALELIEFILNETKLPMIYYEIFCNFLYQMLRTGSSACKKPILNYIFKLKGHRFFLDKINECDNEAVVLKFQIVLAEIISQLVQFLQNENVELRYFEMVFKSRSDNNFLIMLKIFSMYIDLKWQPWTENKISIASIGSALNFFHDKKLMFDDGIRYLLLSSFIKSFTSESVRGDESLKKASKIVEKFSSSVKLELDQNFINWWIYENRNKKDECDKLIIKFISRNYSFFDYLNRDNTAIFDGSKLLMKNFLDKNNEKVLRQNLLKVFMHIQLDTKDLQGLRKYFQKLIEKDTSSETIYIMAALKSNANQFHSRVCKTTGTLIDKLLNKEFKSIDIRAGALHLAIELINQIM